MVMNNVLNKNEIMYCMSIINSVLTKEPIDDSYSTQIDYDIVYRYIYQNGLLGICFNDLFEKNRTKDLELKNKLRKSIIMSMIRQKRMNNSVLELLELAEQRNIRMVLFKGLELARLYPDPNLRFSSDADIYVSLEERESAIKLLEEKGFTYKEAGSKDLVLNFCNQDGCKIELHSCLWEDYKGTLAKKLDRLDLLNKKKLKKVKYKDNSYYTLGYEEHLIFQMFHIIKHFIIESVNIRYLIDVTLFINSHIDEIDFNDFWVKMKNLGYEEFCYYYFSLGVKYFSLDPRCIEKVKDKYNFNSTIEDILLHEFWIRDYNDEFVGSYNAIGVMSEYLMQDVEHSNITNRLLFPKADEISDVYTYLNKYPFLLPVAWVHRAIRKIVLVINDDNYRSNKNSMYKKSNKKVDIIKKIGLA